MIEVIVKEEEKTVEKIEFPVLMKATETEQIVLFTSEFYGVLLYKNTLTSINVGDYVERWVSCFNKNHWQKYEGEITLKNK